MDSAANKETCKRFYQLMENGDIPSMLELIDPEMVDHAMPPGLPNGIEGFKKMNEMWFAAFSDVTVTPVTLVAEGDRVAAHLKVQGRHTGEFMGQPASGKSVEMTMTEIIRFSEDGKCAERWANEGIMELMIQLELMPPPSLT